MTEFNCNIRHNSLLPHCKTKFYNYIHNMETLPFLTHKQTTLKLTQFNFEHQSTFLTKLKLSLKQTTYCQICHLNDNGIVIM